MMLLADFTLGDDFRVTINNQTQNSRSADIYSGV
ncbi:hypothetical protein L914_03007 [Phytophthora nicotianae]|uniref:Uncharacterized protein n=1 Tax=Phytophthora nicotianae TaxID=4792 RepID=W2NYF3_PHYNI|nr:hypothetical protein L914_03007 [Phytophthora nicotianae]